jgi:hypothetical protein
MSEYFSTLLMAFTLSQDKTGSCIDFWRNSALGRHKVTRSDFQHNNTSGVRELLENSNTWVNISVGTTFPS